MPPSFIVRIKEEDAKRAAKEAEKAAKKALKEAKKKEMLRNAAVLWDQLMQVGFHLTLTLALTITLTIQILSICNFNSNRLDTWVPGQRLRCVSTVRLPGRALLQSV